MSGGLEILLSYTWNKMIILRLNLGSTVTGTQLHALACLGPAPKHQSNKSTLLEHSCVVD